MSEATGCTSPPINGDTHIQHIADVPEQIIQVIVRHLEGHVSDVKGLRGGVLRAWRPQGPLPDTALGFRELDYHVASLEHLHVQVLDSGLGILDLLEVDIGKTVLTRVVSNPDLIGAEFGSW